MENLEKLSIDVDSISLTPISSVSLFLKSGAKVDFTVPLTPIDFATLLNTKKRKVKIAADCGYIYINKSRVDFYQITKITNY